MPTQKLHTHYPFKHTPNVPLCHKKLKIKTAGNDPTRTLSPTQKMHYWWWLLSSPAEHNELVSLELLWAWAHGDSEVTRSKIVFLIETWSNEKQMENLRCKLQFSSKLVVPTRGKGVVFVCFGKMRCISKSVAFLLLISML